MEATANRTRNEGWFRAAASAAMLAIFYSTYAKYAPGVLAASLLVLCIYLGAFWMTPRSWTTAWIIAFSAVMMAVALIVHYAYGAPAADLIAPLVVLMALLRNKIWPDVIALLALLALPATTYPGPWPVGTVLGLSGLFFWFRGRRIREDAQALSEMHLRELEKANEELRTATVDSLRYAALEERMRIAQEIHDGLGHHLTSLIIQLQALELMLPDDPGRASETAAQLLDIARGAMGEVRTAIQGWSDDEAGLGVAALRGLVARMQARSPLRIEFTQSPDLTEWPSDTTVVLYRVLQESLTNIMRHAEADTVAVRVREGGGRVALTVEDDGRYSNRAPLTPGFGLRGIAERCRAEGGTFALNGVEPHGLRIEASLPLPAP